MKQRRWTLRREYPHAEGMASGIPWYYGVAWPADFGRLWICYPIPLHWVARLVRECWWAIQGPGYLARRDLALQDAAYRDGWRACEEMYLHKFEQLDARLRRMPEQMAAAELERQRRAGQL